MGLIIAIRIIRTWVDLRHIFSSDARSHQMDSNGLSYTWSAALVWPHLRVLGHIEGIDLMAFVPAFWLSWLMREAEPGKAKFKDGHNGRKSQCPSSVSVQWERPQNCSLFYFSLSRFGFFLFFFFSPFFFFLVFLKQWLTVANCWAGRKNNINLSTGKRWNGKLFCFSGVRCFLWLTAAIVRRPILFLWLRLLCIGHYDGHANAFIVCNPYEKKVFLLRQPKCIPFDGIHISHLILFNNWFVIEISTLWKLDWLWSGLSQALAHGNSQCFVFFDRFSQQNNTFSYTITFQY